MKKKIILVVSILLAAYAAFAAEEGKPEQKPITKVMLARLGWVQSITKNVAYSDFEGVIKDAKALAAQTKKVGDASPAAFGKEKNLAISDLANAIADAASKKDFAVVTAKFSDILRTCSSCHVKLRDK